MTVLYQDAFDGDTIGQLPTGWTNITGAWSVATKNAASGQALLDASGTNLDVVLYTGKSVADGTLTFDQKMVLASSDARQNIVTPLFRCAPDYSTGYYLGLTTTSNQAGLYKRAGGSYVQVGGNVGIDPSAVVTYAAGDVLRVEVKFVGSTFEYRYWNVTTGGSRPSSPAVSFTDASYASGYTGVAITDTSGASNAPALDNFVVADTATAPAPATGVTIARNDQAIFYSPGNWCDDGTSHMTSNPGAYCKFSFSGTSLTLLTTALTTMSAFPQLRAIIDGVAVDVAMSTATSYALATGLAAGTHTCELYLRSSLWSAASWWNLVNALKITGFQLDTGGTVSAPTLRSKIMLVFGDSETQAYLLDGPSSPANDDALGNYVSPLAESLDAEYGQVGWGGTNFASAGISNVPAFNTSYAFVASGFSRLTAGTFTVQPDYISVMLGTNGAPAQADVATAIANLRAAAPAAWLFVIVPGCGAGRAQIAAAVAAAIAGGDTKLRLIDAGTRYQTGLNASGSHSATEAAPADGVHYGRRTNARLGAAWSAQIKDALEPRRFTVVAA